MLNATTIDLGETRSWTNDEAREARRLELGEEALELHAEILELVERERQGKYGMCVRLGRMSHEALWKHFGLHGSFEDYAVKSGAATCHTGAREMALLAKQLRSLPLLRKLFEAGKAGWTLIRDAALAAIEKPEDEEHWAEEVLKGNGELLRRKSREARGLVPTKRSTMDLPLDVDALWDHYRDVVGQRIGRRITKVESMEHLVVSALRGEAWKDAPELDPEPLVETSLAETAPIEASLAGAGAIEDALGDAGPSEAAAAETALVEPSKSTANTRASRIPNPPALLHLHECRHCRKVEIDGSVGPVPLSLGLTATFRDDAFVQDAKGDVSRTIPSRIRRRVYARDRGTCVVPGCGARGFLQNHHEGERGWKETGHDEELLFLLCTAHHALRHEGWLRIGGTVSTGLRWLNASGKELEGPEVSTWWPEPPATSSPSPSEVEVANTTCHPRVRETASPAHAADAVRDARLALRAMGMKLKEGDALICVALSQLPADATASEILTAACRAMH
jgi:hypothetical protein